MEKKRAKITIPLDYIRGLIIAQEGKCAITGLPLDPQQINADHILPLSRADLNPSAEEDNIWLVHKKVNAMKGTMAYFELIDMCKRIIDHLPKTEILLRTIRGREVKPVSKSEFDRWIEVNCDKDGKFRT